MNVNKPFNELNFKNQLWNNLLSQTIFPLHYKIIVQFIYQCCHYCFHTLKFKSKNIIIKSIQLMVQLQLFLYNVYSNLHVYMETSVRKKSFFLLNTKKNSLSNWLTTSFVPWRTQPKVCLVYVNYFMYMIYIILFLYRF